MNLIQNITYISGMFLGFYILLLAYGIIPSKLKNKDQKLSKAMKAVGFVVLISSIVRLLQIWL